jgi:hypothetical protein
MSDAQQIILHKLLDIELSEGGKPVKTQALLTVDEEEMCLNISITTSKCSIENQIYFDSEKQLWDKFDKLSSQQIEGIVSVLN